MTQMMNFSGFDGDLRYCRWRCFFRQFLNALRNFLAAFIKLSFPQQTRHHSTPQYLFGIDRFSWSALMSKTVRHFGNIQFH